MRKVSLREIVADKIVFAILIALAIIRTILFYIMDTKGV